MADSTQKRSILISVLIEFAPVTAFFITAYLTDFLTGVEVLALTTLGVVILSLIRDRRVPLFPLIGSALVLFSSSVTLLTENPLWVVLQSSFYNLFFGAVLLTGFFFKKPLLKPLFESLFAISDRAWMILSLRWGIFFLMVGVGSELVWRFFSFDAWIFYRFLILGAIVAFSLWQFLLARRERLPEANRWGLRVAPIPKRKRH